MSKRKGALPTATTTSHSDGFVYRIHEDGHAYWEFQESWCRSKAAYCKDCGSKLSRYNPNDYCSICLDRRATAPVSKYECPSGSITSDVREMLEETLESGEYVNLYSHFRELGSSTKKVSTAICINAKYYKRRGLTITNVRGEGHRLEPIA